MHAQASTRTPPLSQSQLRLVMGMTPSLYDICKEGNVMQLEQRLKMLGSVWHLSVLYVLNMQGGHFLVGAFAACSRASICFAFNRAGRMSRKCSTPHTQSSAALRCMALHGAYEFVGVCWLSLPHLEVTKYSLDVTTVPWTIATIWSASGLSKWTV